MTWVVISFLCSLSGCMPLPVLGRCPSIEACREVRESIVTPVVPGQTPEFWIEAFVAGSRVDED